MQVSLPYSPQSHPGLQQPPWLQIHTLPFPLLEVPTPPPQKTHPYEERGWGEISSLIAFLPSENLRLFSLTSDMSSSSEALGRITELMMVVGVPRLLMPLSQLHPGDRPSLYLLGLDNNFLFSPNGSPCGRESTGSEVGRFLGAFRLHLPSGHQFS